MIYNVEMTENAFADLDALLSSYGSYTTKVRLSDKVNEVIEQLGQLPFMFSASLDEGLALRGFRRIVIEISVMLYKVAQGKEEVIIHNFFYGKQNYAK